MRNWFSEYDSHLYFSLPSACRRSTIKSENRYFNGIFSRNTRHSFHVIRNQFPADFYFHSSLRWYRWRHNGQWQTDNVSLSLQSVNAIIIIISQIVILNCEENCILQQRNGSGLTPVYLAKRLHTFSIVAFRMQLVLGALQYPISICPFSLVPSVCVECVRVRFHYNVDGMDKVMNNTVLSIAQPCSPRLGHFHKNTKV